MVWDGQKYQLKPQLAQTFPDTWVPVGKISVIAIHHRPLLSALRFSAELGAELTVPPGFLEEVKAIFKEALIPTLQEPRCEALYET